MRLVAALALVLVVALPGAGAWAQDPDPTSLTEEQREERAKAHFDLGREQFRLGRFAAAVTEFENSYIYEQRPLLLYDIAQASRLAGQLQKSITYYRKYLDAEPATPKRAEIAHAIAELEQTIEKAAAQGAAVDGQARSGAVSAQVLTSRPPPARPRRRWPIWIGVSAGVVVLGVVVAVAVTQSPHPPPPTILGNVHPFLQ